MTREECESKLLELAEEMREVLNEYENGDFEYLDVVIYSDTICGNNNWFDGSHKKKVDFYCKEGGDIDAL